MVFRHAAIPRKGSGNQQQQQQQHDIKVWTLGWPLVGFKKTFQVLFFTGQLPHAGNYSVEALKKNDNLIVNTIQ